MYINFYTNYLLLIRRAADTPLKNNLKQPGVTDFEGSPHLLFQAVFSRKLSTTHQLKSIPIPSPLAAPDSR